MTSPFFIVPSAPRGLAGFGAATLMPNFAKAQADAAEYNRQNHLITRGLGAVLAAGAGFGAMKTRGVGQWAFGALAALGGLTALMPDYSPLLMVVNEALPLPESVTRVLTWQPPSSDPNIIQ